MSPSTAGIQLGAVDSMTPAHAQDVKEQPEGMEGRTAGMSIMEEKEGYEAGTFARVVTGDV